jgi:hypothetical protein
MAYQTNHCSAAFRCSVCLIAFLHTSLTLFVLPLFMLYAPFPFTAQFLFCALCAMSIHCTVPLLCSSAAALSSFFTHEPPSPTTFKATSNSNNNLFSSLYRIYVASVHLVHAIFSIPLHAHPTLISSTSQVFCVIIIVTLQLLWLFSHTFNITGCYAKIPQPLWQLRLFIFFVTVEPTFPVFYRPQCPSSCP